MPLRLSRQLLLDQWNEAIAFVSSTLDARLATCDAHAGVRMRQETSGRTVLLWSVSEQTDNTCSLAAVMCTPCVVHTPGKGRCTVSQAYGAQTRWHPLHIRMAAAGQGGVMCLVLLHSLLSDCETAPNSDADTQGRGQCRKGQSSHTEPS